MCSFVVSPRARYLAPIRVLFFWPLIVQFRSWGKPIFPWCFMKPAHLYGVLARPLILA